MTVYQFKMVNGEQVALTDAEIAELEARDAEWQPPRRAVAKSVVLSRLTDNQLDQALALMSNRQKERWRAPDVPTVFADDQEVIGLIQAIGADPAVVLAE